ncbi:MAG TPA: O-antigen ligase family protein [Candidatus Eremiobacteraceae bacterium]|nr:O-antigen ligase family protein [Candidatus Eremiobacteraceae bacterium]
MKGRTQLIFLLAGITAILLLFALAEHRPGLFANTTILGAILALQIAFFGLSHFETAFFPLLIGTFLWAGSALPFHGTAMSLRWLFLAIGALGGFLIWIKKRPHTRHFGSFHLVALFCVASAIVTAMVSDKPKPALLKVLSLFLLFLYASSGARIAIAGREKKFVTSLVLASEVLVYLSAVCYIALHFSVFGNPNALGAVVGVVAVPILLWAAATAETRGLRQRRFFALLLCGGLLYISNSRASILGAATVILLFAIAMRQQRRLLQCAFVCVFLVTVMAVVDPSHLNELASSVTGKVLYKERGTVHGVFASRVSPWSETLSVVKRHPWFGSGFGTSDLGDLRPDSASSSVYTKEGTNREHGNSYLALAEYSGILGAVPFLVLLLMLLRTLAHVYRWMRKTGSPFHYCIPFALVASAGLVHAFFEDWLFAVGSYLCVFFWVAAFVLIDLVPVREPRSSTILFQPSPRIMAVSSNCIFADK